MIICHLILSIYVYYDARKELFKRPRLYAFYIALTGLIGFLIYLIYKKRLAKNRPVTAINTENA